MKHVGLLGGSFDPPHRGHLYISMEAKKILSLDEIWWLVTPQNPLKISKPATYQERFKNCKKITKGTPIKIKEIEKKIDSQFTYQTLNYILKHYSGIKFFWLMGADNLINFHKWQNWRKIFSEISIVIFKRHGYNNNALKSIAYKKFLTSKIKDKSLNKIHFQKLPSWYLVNNKEVKISSSEIRKQRAVLRD
tara:strand:- start:2000 stop:2575 length:576 start_codon:yes stop_codon:yes gene_type:complete